jgi:hypothetical protein
LVIEGSGGKEREISAKAAPAHAVASYSRPLRRPKVSDRSWNRISICVNSRIAMVSRAVLPAVIVALGLLVPAPASRSGALVSALPPDAAELAAFSASPNPKPRVDAAGDARRLELHFEMIDADDVEQPTNTHVTGICLAVYRVVRATSWPPRLAAASAEP